MAGTVTWGRTTSDETHSRKFSDGWAGTGQASGTGDGENLILDGTEYMISEMVELGAGNATITIDKYDTGSGPAPTIEYKNGDSEANCDADSWNVYSGEFTSLGFVRIRVSN